MIETVKEFLKQHKQTQKWLAMNIDVSDAQISSFLAGTYKGNVQSLELKLKNFIENFIPNEDKSQELELFIENQNTAFINHIITNAIKQVRLSVITGEPGYGKTTAVKKFISNRPNKIYIKANNLLTTKDFLAILCKELNIKIENRGREMFESIISALSRVNKFIVIDEAEWLKDKTIDMMRNIWEESNTPVILVGTLILKQNLKGVRGELEYVNSRIRGRYTLEAIKDEDILRICKHYNVAKDGIDRVKTLADGSFRLTTYLLNEARDLANGLKMSVITAKVINEASRMIID